MNDEKKAEIAQRKTTLCQAITRRLEDERITGLPHFKTYPSPKNEHSIVVETEDGQFYVINVTKAAYEK